MEDQIVHLLANTQLSEQGPRQQAELDLKRVQTDPTFTLSLANIASHTSISTAIRQAALSKLRLFIQANWAKDDSDAEPQIPISEEARVLLKQSLLNLVLSGEEDRKVKIAASYAAGKIAVHDFPDQWPDLLPTVLQVMPSGSESQVHGALRLLGDLVEESLSETQFFSMARDIVTALSEVALKPKRKPVLRALAVSVFRGCLEILSMVKESHARDVEAFAKQLLEGDPASSVPGWITFFLNVLSERLPVVDLSAGQPESWNGVIALKLQAVKTLLRLRRGFSNLLSPHRATLFSAVWAELTSMQEAHRLLYLDSNAQGRLDDADNLPYTLDFLLLEEIDFLNQCFRAPAVKTELDTQLQAHASVREVPWMTQIMAMLVNFACVTREEEELWDIDCSLYLAEETSASANYTARTAAGDLLIKLGEWFGHNTIDGLFNHTASLFPGNDEASWRRQEAALYLFVMLLGDFQDRSVPVPQAIADEYFKLVNYAITRTAEPLLRARGHLVTGVLGKSFQLPLWQANGAAPTMPMLDHMIKSITTEQSEVVQVACIKAIEGLISAGKTDCDKQVPFLLVIQTYVDSKDPLELEDADELLVTLAEALRAAFSLNMGIALSDDVRAMDLLFLLAKLGAFTFQVNALVSDAFEAIVQESRGNASYSAICTKVLPTLTSAFDVAKIIEDAPLITIAAELLALLAEHGPEPLPAGFVAATFPKLTRILMESTEGEVLRPSSETLKWILSRDHQQVFSWHDPSGASGLEVCLHVIDRLLKSDIQDNAASEVGGLAAELVEKAGQERLGPYLPQLLEAVASRVHTAEAAAFIQSLILVFARLSLAGAQDVVELLDRLQINGQNGLQLVLTKWLENSINFAGYDEIRQNIIALSKLFSLNDVRLTQITVKGDLIVDVDDGRIKTRSQSRRNPDRYTIIPAPLKIIKILIEELVSASGARTMANATAAAMAANNLDSDDSEDGWEDDGILDLGSSATKIDLLSFTEEGSIRQVDGGTQAYLTDFFLRCAREDVANFQQWYALLSEDEKTKLNELAETAERQPQ